MTYKIVITPVAQKHIEEAIIYYGDKLLTKSLLCLFKITIKRSQIFKKYCVLSSFLHISEVNR